MQVYIIVEPLGSWKTSLCYITLTHCLPAAVCVSGCRPGIVLSQHHPQSPGHPGPLCHWDRETRAHWRRHLQGPWVRHHNICRAGNLGSENFGREYCLALWKFCWWRHFYWSCCVFCWSTNGFPPQTLSTLLAYFSLLVVQLLSCIMFRSEKVKKELKERLLKVRGQAALDKVSHQTAHYTLPSLARSPGCLAYWVFTIIAKIVMAVWSAVIENCYIETVNSSNCWAPT